MCFLKIQTCLPVLLSVSVICLATDRCDSADATLLKVDASQATEVKYDIEIAGTIITPAADGSKSFPLKSRGEFRFQNFPSPTEVGGPFTLRGARVFQSAATETTVAEDHTTNVALSTAYRTIHVFGSEKGLHQMSPQYSLPRKQLDLLQMPFDVLAVGSLLPKSAVNVGDKWNTDTWLVPMLTGVESVVEQSATCELKSLTETEATISIAGTINGAVQGSAADISFSGLLTFDRAKHIASSLSVTQAEKRSPGPVSPGLEVKATVKWSQAPIDDAETSHSVTAEGPTDEQLQLFLQTPLRLQLRHSREWHLFHETPNVLMMRQLRDGNLISQCNISSSVTVPPKQHTPDQEFLTDVSTAVKERSGSVLQEKTIREDAAWRIRHIQALGDADGEVIVWDYYLCTAVSGEQYSLVFSHSRNDDKAFGDAAERILRTLAVARPRPALPFR